MIDALYRAATGRAVLVTLVMLLVSGFAIFRLGPYPALVAAGAALPEETPGMSPERIHAFLDTLGETGRAGYARFQALDTVQAMLLAGFAMLLVAWILKRAGSARGAWRVLALVPLIVLGAEAVENVLLARAALAHPSHAATTAFLPAVTTIKFASVVLMVLALLVALGRRLRAALAARHGAS